MAAVADLQKAVDGWAAALAADALSPQPSYTLDNKSVSRNEWRKSLVESIAEANRIIAMLNPYWLQSAAR